MYNRFILSDTKLTVDELVENEAELKLKYVGNTACREVCFYDLITQPDRRNKYIFSKSTTTTYRLAEQERPKVFEVATNPDNKFKNIVTEYFFDWAKNIIDSICKFQDIKTNYGEFRFSMGNYKEPFSVYYGPVKSVFARRGYWIIYNIIQYFTKSFVYAFDEEFLFGITENKANNFISRVDSIYHDLKNHKISIEDAFLLLTPEDEDFYLDCVLSYMKEGIPTGVRFFDDFSHINGFVSLLSEITGEDYETQYYMADDE